MVSTGGRPPSLAENFRSDIGVVVMISTGDEGNSGEKGGEWPPSFPAKQWGVQRASSAPAKIAATASRRQAGDGFWAATPAISAISAMSLFTTQSPTGVAITSSGSKKGGRFVADLNIKLKSKKITTDIKVDSNSNAGSSARAVGSNNVNEHSSRSHCILCIMVRAKNLVNGECTKSKLWLVDLAGSERLAKTDVQGDRLKEAQNINRSLSALGDVVSALANKSSHIPYRNSKLTHLLQDSLGGDSKALMFVQISPSDKDLSETLSSLNFATRVRGVELGPVRKQIDTSELQKMKAMLDKARHDSRSKDESLKKLEDSLRIIESKTREKEQAWKSQQDEIKELKGQLESKMSLHSQSEKQILLMSDRLKGSEEMCSTLQQKVTDLEKKLREQEQLDYENYKNKIKDLEKKLKEQLQESEAHSIILQLKVDELEKKLKEQEKNSEELEKKLKEEQEKNSTIPPLQQVKVEEKVVKKGKKEEQPAEAMDETTDDHHHILKNSNAVNCQKKELSVQRKRMSTNGEAENSAIPPTSKRKEHETPVAQQHEVRRKRVSKNEVENNGFLATSERRGRKSDPPKLFGGGVKPPTPKPSFVPSAAAQRTLQPRGRGGDPVQGVKERGSKKRIWSR